MFFENRGIYSHNLAKKGFLWEGFIFAIGSYKKICSIYFYNWFISEKSCEIKFCDFGVKSQK